MLKIKASKLKFKIRISQKPLGFSKNDLSKSFLEFYRLQSFLLEAPTVKIA